MIEVGDGLPAAVLTSSAGAPVSLAQFLGQRLVLYTYPRADTSGCTRQAQDFSANLQQMQALGANILGVSRDAPAALARFIAKYALTVPLASDDDGGLIEALGARVEKRLYGRTYMGIDRATFLFDADGQLVRVWRKVRVRGHSEQLLAALRDLGQP